MIIPVYKQFGESTHLLAQKVGELYGEKATHTGTLDPAAEGVVVVLIGDDRFNKQKLASTRKTYQVQIVFGISTDTHDLLGLPTEVILSPRFQKRKALQALASLTGSYDQTLPAFSARRRAGSSYFEFARQGITFSLDSQAITIYSIDLLSSTKVSLKELTFFYSTRINEVGGDLRQTEIKEKARELLEYFGKHSVNYLPSITLKVNCSKRTYIRSLVRDLSEKISIPATVMSLTRIANGSFTISDCLQLV